MTALRDLDGRVAVVTGATGGLGRRLALALANAGSDVAVVCRASLDEARTIAGELEALGVRAQPFAADCADPAAVDALHEEIVAALGPPDVLVNNAAINERIAFDDLDALTPEVWDRILRTNTTGPFLCSRTFAPSLRSDGRGRIVNVSSIAGLAPLGSSIAYAVSKSALNHLTRCMAIALAPDVLVNAVAPGYMEETRMSAKMSAAQVGRSIGDAVLKRPALRDDVAEQLLTFVRTESTTGQIVAVDAGRVFH